MSWYSSTLISGQRLRSDSATSGSAASRAAGSSMRPSRSTRSREPRALVSFSRVTGSPAASASSRLPAAADPASSAATSSSSVSSATRNPVASPASSWCSRRIIRPSPCRVVTVTRRSAPAGSLAVSRACISSAARRVNVIARHDPGPAPKPATWRAIRCVSVCVLPVPGPATIISGPSASAAAS
jgi:hypothetical protein